MNADEMRQMLSNLSDNLLSDSRKGCCLKKHFNLIDSDGALSEAKAEDVWATACSVMFQIFVTSITEMNENDAMEFISNIQNEIFESMQIKIIDRVAF